MHLLLPTITAALSVGTATTPSCETTLRRLFGGPSISADEIVKSCSHKIVWDDISASSPIKGPTAVKEMLESKFPPSSRLTVERLSDGVSSGGFTWHRSKNDCDDVGLRGTLFAEVDSEGLLEYVCVGQEPLFKPGEAIEALLKAVTANVEKPPKPAATFTQRTPTSASDLVNYLWQEAYPNGADPTEALRLFDGQKIRYEDFNYETPFLGMEQVKAFVTAFDIPGVEFVPRKISEGDRAVAFTWCVMVNGNEGPSGISFYEVDPETKKVVYIRDIPAPSLKPPPLATLAATFDPLLQVFDPKARTVA